MTEDKVIKAKEEYFIGKEKALVKIRSCPRCQKYGRNFDIFEVNDRNKRTIVRCSYCGKDSFEYELIDQFILPREEKIHINVDILDKEMGKNDMLASIFNMNKRFTDAVRDEEKPRIDLAENIMSTMLKDFSDHNISFDEEDLILFEKSIKDTRMLRNGVAMNAEVAEYIDELSWKWWGRGKHTLNKKKAAMELVDLLHFMMIAFDDLGYRASDIYTLYCEKQLENRRRFIEKIGWNKANR